MPVRSDNFIFYHIPKTGGSWIMRTLDELGIKTERYRDRHVTKFKKAGLKKDHIVPKDTPYKFKGDRFAFCFVRHPVTWYKSFWSHRMRLMIKNGTSQNEHIEFAIDLPPIWDNNFSKFMSNVIDAFPDGYASHIYQCYFQGQVFDFVGKQRSLVEDTITVYKMLGLKFNPDFIKQIGPANKAYSRPELEELCVSSKALEDKIVQVDNWIIDRFY